MRLREWHLSTTQELTSDWLQAPLPQGSSAAKLYQIAQQYDCLDTKDDHVHKLQAKQCNFIEVWRLHGICCTTSALLWMSECRYKVYQSFREIIIVFALTGSN